MSRRRRVGKLIANKELTIRQGVVFERGIKRRVVLAWLGEDLLNREVVASGYVWYQPGEFAAPELQTAFKEAQQAKRGFWSNPEPPLSPWKIETFIEKFGVNAKRGKKPNISAQELLSYVKEYDKQYTEAVTLLEKAQAYHDPHGQRHKLRAGQLHIRNIVSNPPEETAEERTVYDAQMAWAMPDRLYAKGTRKYWGDFEYALQKRKGWFSIQRGANAKLRVDDNWEGTEPIFQLLECLEAVLFQPSLIKVGEPAVEKRGLRFYGLVDDNAKKTAYLMAVPPTSSEDNFHPFFFGPPALAIDRQSGRLVGLSFLSGGSDQKKLKEFLPPPATFVMHSRRRSSSGRYETA